MQNQYINSGKINYFLEIYNVLPEEHKTYFKLNNTFLNKDETAIIQNRVTIEKLSSIEKQIKKPSFLQKLFSVKNEDKHKVLRLLGLKFKFRRGE